MALEDVTSVLERVIDRFYPPEEAVLLKMEARGEALDYEDYSQSSLELEAQTRGLDATGDKEALISRLERDDSEREEDSEGEEE